MQNELVQGGGASKKQKLEEKQLELELRKTVLAEKEADNKAREIGLKEQRLKALDNAINNQAGTEVIAALGDDESFELGEPREKTSS
ncbi:MAG: hypothetical protein CMI52_01065 [Parcubacteria group bacterium]|nr:hypothetical protein [Parcubacteria group bacterium]|tara:strand:+ start:230 stop:490 length:261 start_codon:yes stop_codon:yes gene_type:complete